MAEPSPFSSTGVFSPVGVSLSQWVEPVPVSSSGAFGAMRVRQTYEALVVPVDWSVGLLERLEWLTDTQGAYDGNETRIRLREYPRRVLEFGFGVGGRARRRLEAFLYGRGAKRFAMPIWTDGMELGADLASGAVAIPVATADRDFHAGALVFLVDADGNFEASQVLNVEANSVELRQPTAQAWPAGTMVYPGRMCRLPPQQDTSRFTGDYLQGRFRVSVLDPNQWTEATEATTYRGLPVMVDAPNWVGSLDVGYLRKLAELDFSTGPASYDDESGRPEIVQSMRWLMTTRAAVGAFKAWAYRRAGKFAAIWVPTWVEDIVMTSNLGSGGTSFDFEAIGYTRQIATGTHRKDLRIELNSGAVYYRRITGAAVVDADTESLTIDSALGVAITPANVNRISFMALSRLDGDGVEIAWFTGEAGQATTNVRATGNDL